MKKARKATRKRPAISAAKSAATSTSARKPPAQSQPTSSNRLPAQSQPVHREVSRDPMNWQRIGRRLRTLEHASQGGIRHEVAETSPNRQQTRGRRPF